MIKRPADRKEPRKISHKRKADRSLFEVGGSEKLLRVDLDWRAYFYRFAEEHGGNPVEIDGRQVFPDGWSYSTTDYRGPEWSSPLEPALTQLLIRYWTERYEIVWDELKALKLAREDIVQQSIYRSVPLQRKVKVLDEVSGKVQRTAEDVTTVVHDERIKWLEGDLEYCQEQLNRLKGAKDASQSVPAGTVPSLLSR